MKRYDAVVLSDPGVFIMFRKPAECRVEDGIGQFGEVGMVSVFLRLTLLSITGKIGPWRKPLLREHGYSAIVDVLPVVPIES